MRELSLFSGAGGGLLGTKLLGWEHCGYVEFNEYCQKIIAQRIEDGILDRAPIFSDIAAFIDQGYADAYQGMVDVVTAGFPCQPFSVAGKQAGEDDERNMWPQTIDVIRRVQPRFAFLENVPGLLAHPYARRIFGDLAESGFDVRWRVLSAAEVGAPHKRDRLWIVADRNEMANTNSCDSSQRGSGESEKQQFSGLCKNVPNSEQNGLQGGSEPGSSAEASEGIKQGGEVAGIFSKGNGTSSWWATEPDVGRVANGVASRVDRLKAIGNGQVPAVVRAAWELLNAP